MSHQLTSGEERKPEMPVTITGLEVNQLELNVLLNAWCRLSRQWRPTQSQGSYCFSDKLDFRRKLGHNDKDLNLPRGQNNPIYIYIYT